MESIKVEVTSFNQNEKLLSMLSRKTKDQFDKFLEALDKTGQHHTRNKLTGCEGLLLCWYNFLCSKVSLSCSMTASCPPTGYLYSVYSIVIVVVCFSAALFFLRAVVSAE